MSRGAVSQQIAALEQHLGLTLMDRTTRKIELTEAGEQIYASARRSFDDLLRTIELVLERQRAASIQVSVSTYFSARWLSSKLGHFWETHPDIQLLFKHTSDSDAVDLDESEVAIRWGFGDWEGVASIAKLFGAPMTAYCAPSLFAHLGRPPTYEDLADVVLLTDKEKTWRKWFARAGIHGPDLSNSRYIADSMFRVQAAIDGHGVLLGDRLLQQEISSGDLIAPFEATVPDCGFYVLAREDRLSSAEAKTFCRWLVSEAANASPP